MVSKIHRDALKSEIASLREMLDRSAGHDPLGSLSLHKRLRRLEAELDQLEGHTNNYANVALVFDGDPVRGSSAIEVNFAGKALQDFQELISKHVAVDAGQLADRGPLSAQTHDQARMNITALVHGSFGFVLEEDAADQLGMFETPAQRAVRSVTDLLRDVSATDGRPFDTKLDELDARIFSTLKRFVSTLHRAHSTLRVAEEQRELTIDPSGVERAFERVSQSEVEEVDDTVDGDLLGLVPVQRRFDFRRSDNGEILQGRVSANLSADYLERIEREGFVAGKRWRAVIRSKSVHHPDGRHVNITRLLIDLSPLEPTTNSS
jgi:hypothetical protein